MLVVTGGGATGHVMVGGEMIVVFDGSMGLHVASTSAQAVRAQILSSVDPERGSVKCPRQKETAARGMF